MSENLRRRGVGVTVYAKPLCPDCREAERVISAVGVPFKAVDVSQNKRGANVVKKECERAGLEPTVPVIIIREKKPFQQETILIEPRGIALRALGITLLALRFPIK